MPKLRVHCFSISVDGFGAGPDQGPDNPLGVGARRLHEWAFATRTFRGIVAGGDGGETDLDDDYVRRGFDGIGATVMGRNMFGPIRGPWPDETWKGWWGENPPYHHPVFVLTHHAHPPLAMQGGTTFHFVTGGIDAALAQAFDAARGLDVRLGGGVSAVQQYLSARLIDELHITIAPVLLGRGERLFANAGDLAATYECRRMRASGEVMHIELSKR